MAYYIIILALLGLMIFAVARSIYYCFDHSYFGNADLLESDASIVGFSSEKVSYSKNGAKFKTTITFSDGFRFITHKTNRKNNFLTYTISIDNELGIQIIESAIKAHQKAIDKRDRSNKST